VHKSHTLKTLYTRVRFHPIFDKANRYLIGYWVIFENITAQQIRLYTDGIPMGVQLLKDGGEQRVVFYLIFLRIYSNLHDVSV